MKVDEHAILIENPQVEGEAVVPIRSTFDPVPPLEWLDLKAQPRIYHIALSSGDAPFTAYCLELPGAISEADSREGACKGLVEAFELLVEDYRAEGEDVPWTRAEGTSDGFEIAGTIALDG